MVIDGQLIKGQHPSQWSIYQANWEEFARQIVFHSIGEFHGVNDIVGHFSDVVVGTTKASISQTSSNFLHTLVPWWLEECCKAIRCHRWALHTFSLHPTEGNMWYLETCGIFKILIIMFI